MSRGLHVQLSSDLRRTISHHRHHHHHHHHHHLFAQISKQTYDILLLRHRVEMLCPRPRRERVNKRCFYPSVRLSVASIAKNSRTRRPSVLKFSRKVPHLRCDSHTSFKVKRSKVKVTRPINADTSCAHIFQMARPTLQISHTDGGRRPASSTGAMTSKVKGQYRKVTWSVWALLVQWPIDRKRIVVVSPKFAFDSLIKYQDACDRQSRWSPKSKVKVISSHCLYVSSLPLLNSGNKMCH